MNISQSKILWSQKLVQLAQIFERFPNCYTSTLSVSTGKNGKLSMRCFYKTTQRTRVSEFRQAIQDNTNFFYHFEKLDSRGINRVGDTLSFNVDLVLKGS